MSNDGVVFGRPKFSILSESQIEEIHLATLEVLRRTGVRFYHQEALEMLRKAGAYISDGNLVKFPAHLVKRALGTAPSRVVLSNREGEPAIYLEGNRVYFGTGSDCPNYLDPYTGKHRKFTKADLMNSYKLCDALPNIHFVMSMGLLSNLPSTMNYCTQFALMIQNTTKPIVFVAGDYTSCVKVMEMAAAVAGGQKALEENPFILLYSEPSSPLKQSKEAVDKLLLMAEHQLPVVHSPGPMMGATTPITLAGGLVQSNAEILSSLVVHQLKREGAPFIYGAGIHHMDMSSMQICYGSPEFQLTKAAVAALGKHFGLPTWGYASCSDANVVDEQAALESMFSVLMAQLSGANLIHDVGYLESALTTSLEMVILTDELIDMTNHFMKGITTNKEDLAVDQINQVGPGGNYLSTEETVKRFREFWFPTLLNRKTRLEWEKMGKLSLGQKLNAKVRDILENYVSKPLPSKIQKQVNDILQKVANETV